VQVETLAHRLHERARLRAALGGVLEAAALALTRSALALTEADVEEVPQRLGKVSHLIDEHVKKCVERVALAGLVG
jgi:hypothetical protein